MNPSYSVDQQVHSLCALASASFTTSFNDLPSLQQATTNVVTAVLADSTIQGFIGSDWAPVWGPVVYSDKPANQPTEADNTMMLLYSASQNLLVLSVAGTNPDSAYDWLQEDLQVGSFVSWSDVMGEGFKIDSTYQNAAISTGTATGLTRLLSMTNEDSQTLMEVLTTFTSQLTQSTLLAVTGHSLGGALSPTLALFLNDSQQFSDNWNSGQQVTTIQVYATAGPTPGNSTFAQYLAYSAALPQAVRFGYLSQYNTLDVIPQAWQSDTLAAIPAIYENYIPPVKGANPIETIVGTMATVAFLKTLSKDSSYSDQYTQALPWTPMPGTFSQDTDKYVTKKLNLFLITLVLPKSLKEYAAYFINFVRFLAQMAYQHTEAYDILLGITEFTNEYNKVKTAIIGADQSHAVLREAALSRIIGLDLSKFYLPVENAKPVEQANA